jgi:hypothetical protein
VAHPSRLAVKDGEHLRMTVEFVARMMAVCVDYGERRFMLS